MGKSGGSGKVKVDRYMLSVHMGVCKSLDALYRIFMEDKLAWSGTMTVASTSDIYKPQLFGGGGKEGGPAGRFWYLPGGGDQQMPEALAARLERTPETCPGFRGLASLFFIGDAGGSILSGVTGKELKKWKQYAGFTWRHNTPHLPRVAMLGQCIYSGWGSEGCWYPETAAIPRGAAIRTDTVDLDAVDNASNSGTSGSPEVWVTLDGYETHHLLRLTMPAGGTYTAWRNTTVGNPGWVTLFRVRPEEPFTTSYTFGSFDTDGSDPYFDDPDEARAAFLPGFVSGGTEYRFGIAFGFPEMSEGGVSILVEAFDALDMNPAHVILQCLTDGDFGMGASRTALDLASFEAAADTLLGELLGISVLWVQQTSIEEFVNDILDHIDATLFVNPSTGLITIKLIRDDYDPDTLPLLDETNATLLSFQRKAQGELVNEIVVSWTNPQNEQEESVTWQDNAGIRILDGAIVSDTRNYYMLRRADLAQQLAVRESRAAGAPLATAEVDANRSAGSFVPGGVCKIASPEHEIGTLTMRIVNIGYGKPGDSTVRLSLVEDVFAFPQAQIVDAPPASEHDPAVPDPEPADHQAVMTLPFFLAAAVAPAGVEYPDVLAGILAATDGTASHEYELVGEVVDPAGNLVEEGLGIREFVARAVLPVAWGREATTAIAQSALTISTGDGPVEGGLVVIGPAPGEVFDETLAELGLVATIDGGTITIRRGVLDTVPRAWPAGTALWFVSLETEIHDEVLRAAASNVTYKLLPFTGSGQLPESEAPELTGTLTERPHLPFRPADVSVAGVAFDVVDAVGLDPVPVAWSERNRLTEDAQILAWSDATVTAEIGQTTIVDVLRLHDRVLVSRFDALTGTTLDLPASGTGDAFDGLDVALVRVSSERDSLEALQAHELEVALVDCLLLEDGILLLENGGPLGLG